MRTDLKPANVLNSQEDCAFCEIASGADATVEVVCSSTDWVAFFPDTPATPGHTLLIPRKHVKNLWSADAAIGCELFRGLQVVGDALWRALDPEGMNVITSAGEAAEQTVFHLHLHLVPRWRDDRLDLWPPKQPMKKTLKEDLAAAVRAECAESQPD